MPETFNQLDDLQQLMLRRGHERYSGEPVSHLEHAKQCAEMARQSGGSTALITAALLHDVGHFLSHLPGTPSQGGILPQAEREVFEQLDFHQDALQLRRFDDLAKQPKFVTSAWDVYWQIALSARFA